MPTTKLEIKSIVAFFDVRIVLFSFRACFFGSSQSGGVRRGRTICSMLIMSRFVADEPNSDKPGVNPSLDNSATSGVSSPAEAKKTYD
jgi:hypothetical protein